MNRMQYLLARLIGNDLTKDEAIELYDEITLLVAINKKEKEDEG